VRDPLFLFFSFSSSRLTFVEGEADAGCRRGPCRRRTLLLHTLVGSREKKISIPISRLRFDGRWGAWETVNMNDIGLVGKNFKEADELSVCLLIENAFPFTGKFFFSVPPRTEYLSRVDACTLGRSSST
jgi:hypothetical protein